MNIDPTVWKAHYNYAKGQPDRVTNRLSGFISLFANLHLLPISVSMYDLQYEGRGLNKFGQDRRGRFLPIWSISR